MSNRQIIFILFWSNVILIYAAMVAKTTKLECAPNPKYFYNHTCRLKAVNRYKALGFMETHLRRTLKNVTVNFVLYARNDKNIYRPFLFNITKNGCQVLDGTAPGLYSKVFKKLVYENSNINHTCPLTGMIVANNLYMDTNMLPITWAKYQHFKFLYRFYEGYPYEFIGSVTYYIETIEKREKRN